MNKNIDLTKILEGCPKGTEFYSSIFGKVLFMGIDKGNTMCPILVKVSFGTNILKQFTKEGRFYAAVGECTLFPTKDQRDWSKFERFWDKPKAEKFDVNTLKPFDRVLVRFSDNLNWQIGLFGYKYEKLIYSNGTVYYQCVPYNDETKHLLGTIDACSDYYKWWDKTKVERFDPKTLEPYDRVLVRDSTSRCWKIDFYGYNTNPYVGLINCASGSKPYCIPYNEETKHLLGTANDCPDYYKWWEE